MLGLTRSSRVRPSSAMSSELTLEKLDDDEETSGCVNYLGAKIEVARDWISSWTSEHDRVFKTTIVVIVFLLFNAYLAAAIWYCVSNDNSVDWEDGLGLLIILTSFLYVGFIYYFLVKPYLSDWICNTCCVPFRKVWTWRYVPWVVILTSLVGLLIYIFVVTDDYDNRLRSLLGIIVMILFGIFYSQHPGKIQWRPVVWGLSLQFSFALLTLRWHAGRLVMDAIGRKLKTFLKSAEPGAEMMYGHLATDSQFIFAFQALPIIFFFCGFIQVFYYYGIVQWTVKKLSYLLQDTMGTTACESMNAAANIVFGMSEAPIIIKPYLASMTKSELHAVLTAGFATIAGTVMATYIKFGIDAGHLLTASIMGAPAALAMSKLFYPEVEKSVTRSSDVQITRGVEVNVLDAVAQGATSAVGLVLCITANLIAFFSGIAFLNKLLSWFGSLLGADYITFEWLLGKVFYPFACLLGVPYEDCGNVGKLLGLKTAVNEFVAYQELSKYKNCSSISTRAEIITTYALCGFSNPASIGIQLGALTAMCPSRQSDLAEIVMSAMVAGIFACCTNACIAGLLID